MTQITIGQVGNDNKLDVLYICAGIGICCLGYLVKPLTENYIKTNWSTNKVVSYLPSLASGGLAGFVFKMIRTEGMEGQSGAVIGTVCALIGCVAEDLVTLDTLTDGVKKVVNTIFPFLPWK